MLFSILKLSLRKQKKEGVTFHPEMSLNIQYSILFWEPIDIWTAVKSLLLASCERTGWLGNSSPTHMRSKVHFYINISKILMEKKESTDRGLSPSFQSSCRTASWYFFQIFYWASLSLSISYFEPFVHLFVQEMCFMFTMSKVLLSICHDAIPTDA